MLLQIGLAGSQLVAAGKAAGLRVAEEAFCDRVYEPGGTLRSRSHPDALVEDPQAAAQQAVDIVTRGKVHAHDGTTVLVRADTLCVHGDGPHAVASAAAIRAALTQAGVEVMELGRLL